jgi:hypothetical protein
VWPKFRPGLHPALRLGGTGSLACALVLVTGLIGCADASAPSPGPSDPAGQNDRTGPDGSAPATAAPGTPGTPGPSGAPGPAGALVLRWSRTGGFAGVGGPGTVPAFSLYGDGRIVVPGAAQGVLPILRETRLTPAGLRRVVAAARQAGLERSRKVDRPGVADAFTLEIVFVSGGRTHRTSIVHPEGSGDDQAVRFWRRLDLRGWPRAEIAQSTRPYLGERLAVLAAPGRPGGAASARKWPLRPLDGGDQVLSLRCTVYAGAERETAERAAAGASPGEVWRSGDRVHRVTFRPLLPDERGCDALRPR